MQRSQAAWGGVIAIALAATSVAAHGETTERVSIAATGSQAIGGRYQPRPTVSGDGSTVAFESPIATLVSGDTNVMVDVFVAAGGVITRVPGMGGAQPTCPSQRASLSSTGQFMAFDSCASNLVAGDTNNHSDVFVYDRIAATVTRVSVSTAGVEGNGASFSSAISPNGRYVAFLSQSTNLDGSVGNGTYVVLRDLLNSTTVIASRATGLAGSLASSDVRPSVADDGTVAFVSGSSNLVAGDTNGDPDVFLRRGAGTATPTTVRVSLSATGAQLGLASTRPSISANAQRVTFETAAVAVPADGNGLTDIYVRDIANSTTTLVSRTPSGSSANGNSLDASLSPSGEYVSFTSQASNFDGVLDSLYDVFRATLSPAGAVAVSTVARVSVSTAAATGESGSSDVADTGRIVFASDEPRLSANDFNGDTDVFSTDGTTITRVTVTAPGLMDAYSGASFRPAPSYDGTIVAFLASATNLVSGDTNSRIDVFVRNRTTASTERLPILAGYEIFDADWVTISHDGRFVAYSRGAAFLYDRFNGTTTLISVPFPGGTVAAGAQPRISASGRYVAYTTSAAFDAADTNGLTDVYRFDRLTGVNVLASRGATAGNASSNTAAISGDGSIVGFITAANNLGVADTNGRADVYVRNMNTGVVTRLSTNLDAMPNTVEARDVFVNPDGKFVSFLLSSNILTSEATASSNVYVVASDGLTAPRGPLNGTTEGAVATTGSYDPTLSLFGRFLAYRSYSSDLVAGDTNNAADVFARQILGAPVSGASPPAFGPIQRISVNESGGQATGGSGLDTENPEIIGTAKAVVYQSGLSNLVVSDTNFIVDAFIRAGVFGNGECEFIEATIPGYTAYLALYGLDPCTNAGSPFADPDGDGQTNQEEFTNPGGSTNPVLGAFTRYFAEGATKTAGLDFDTRLAIANPNNAVVTGEISYQLPSGIAVPVTPFTLQPYERATVLLDQQPGVAENGPAASYEFSTTVRASAPIGVDRTMTWDKRVYAGHAETGVVSPSRKWYFAEGATIGGFNLFYLLQNPSAAPVTVQARYLLGTGAVFTKSYDLAPNSRFNIWANVEQIGSAKPLAAAELSAEFTVTAGANIIAERAMYLGSNPLFKAGHESAGVTEPATEWFLAEGNAGDFFDFFVLIGNTTGSTALVQADFIVGNTGVVYTKTYDVRPNSRFNIWVDEEEITPGNRPFRTGNTDISVRIRSINGVPLIVERAMWWPGSSSTWYEAHNSPGSTRTARSWVLAEGENGGAIGWNTYILVANTGTTAGTISVRLLMPGGQPGAVLTGLPIAAQSRTTYDLRQLLETAGLPVNTQAGVLIESEAVSLPLVVERAMYRNVGGITFQVGTNALGNPLP